MNSAVIIFSDDNFFVRFIKENITDVRIICDGNLALDVVFELEDLLDEYSDQIEFEYNRGIEESYDYYEEI
jgi:hypothetical protein